MLKQNISFANAKLKNYRKLTLTAKVVSWSGANLFLVGVYWFNLKVDRIICGKSIDPNQSYSSL